ncbi:MAG TPA: DUF3800 domain-containing protein [Patescibacteria group bacterium]|nr:DUF3800 domain-containing protein [Patescibacteria group bacterium]
MVGYKIISLDESGKASFEHPSKLFVLSAVLVPESFRSKLDNKIKKIKKKFFKDEEIVFHSRDMSRKKGPFSILRDPKTETAFWSEFVSVLNNKDISLIFIITNKTKAVKLGWQPKTILKRSYLRLLELFLIQLNKNKNKGKIIAESDPSQDIYLIEAHNTHQAQNQSYRNNVTSISLVSKSNFDSEVQIADALAPIAGRIFSKVAIKKKVEKIKARLVERKLLDKENSSYLESLV